MALIDYTTFDDIRAALGVSDDEITDATLSLDLYIFNLVSELEGISLTLIAAYALQNVSASNTWTEDQVRFHQSIRLFSTYATAKLATVALPMFSPKEQTDGKTSGVRFSADPYKGTITRVLAQYEVFKVKLEAAYDAITSGTTISTARPYLVIASPSSDPILGT